MIWNEECYHLAFERFIQLAIVRKLDAITPSLQQQTIKIDYTLKAVFGGKNMLHILSALLSLAAFASSVQMCKHECFQEGPQALLDPGGVINT